MNKHSTILVTGATGKQGGAVVRELLKHSFHVKAFTRKPDSDKARQLAALGAEIVTGDLNLPDTYEHHLDGVAGVYSVQTYENGIEKEILQGTELANAAKKHHVPHFIYSSVVGCDLHTGIPHWDSKFLIEQHIRSIEIPHTILRPSSFYENLLHPQVRSGIRKGKLSTPLRGSTKQHVLSAADVGRVAARVFLDPPAYQNRVLTLAAGCMDSEEMSRILSEVSGRRIRYERLPRLITRLFLGKKLYQMFQWIDAHSEQLAAHIEAERFLYDDPVSFRDWAKVHFGK